MHLQLFTIESGEGPILSTAIHDGHDLRPEVERIMKLEESERLREEDPFTAEIADVVDRRVVVHRSRFEVDVNRARDRAIYRTPDDAWGLDVWSEPPPDDLVERSLDEYDGFYESIFELCEQIISRHGHLVVFDIHSYNHRRNGADAPEQDPEENPVVNVGTGTVDRQRWGSLIDRFMDDMRRAGIDGEELDVRENVKFNGGWFSQWTHRTFGSAACVLAIEFKKIFMDEWTGTPDRAKIEALRDALAATVPGVLKELQQR